MQRKRFLVTGAGGCIGAWVLKELIDLELECFGLDISDNWYRPRLLMTEEELRQIHLISGDITKGEEIERVVSTYGISHIIHLAGLQVPFCKANPASGARVNVEGTANIFEAIRHCGAQIRGFVYASSIAVLGPITNYQPGPVSETAVLDPKTHYGVYKQADEAMARVYWNDYGISSIGLRPYIVYGVGRDLGMTSDIAKSILAAAVRRPFKIKFGGNVALQYTRDIAQMFIRSVLAEYPGCFTCNIQNDSVSVPEFLEVLLQVFPDSPIDYDSSVLLPFPHELEVKNLGKIIGAVPHTKLKEAIRETGNKFNELVEQKRIDLKQLEV